MVEVPFRIRLGALKICAYGVQVASRIACAKETGQYRLGALKIWICNSEEEYLPLKQGVVIS